MNNNSKLSRRIFLKGMGLLSTILVMPFCGKKVEEKKLNILWITCEDISPVLGCYGDEYAVTPNLDQLAKEGILFENAFASAPICAPSRSCLITGLYATSMGTQHLRSAIPRSKKIKCLPEYLREQGYYCSNNSKTDYNFTIESIWDESSNKAHWRNRKKDQPFFSVFNYGTTHEGQTNSLDETPLKNIKKRHDPQKANLPPYYPDTPEMRRIWARQYDLITAMDSQVGELIQQLKGDQLYEDTIIFFFSDHGFGLPRYKRWLYASGLRVPLIIRFPREYLYLSNSKEGTKNPKLVSFVDFAPTVLNMVGDKIPPMMEGVPFMGKRIGSTRKFIYGSRSRADDVYDISRAVCSNKYIYIRNYLPHLPYIYSARIFSDRKASYKELWKLKQLGQLNKESQKLFLPKSREELYDLEKDPYETENLIDSPDQQVLVSEMRNALRNWIINTRDTGFLIEAEMMERATGSSPYDLAQDKRKYQIEKILAAAEWVGDPEIRIDALLEGLQNPDSAVRFWAIMALIAKGKRAKAAIPALKERLADSSPVVQISAAQALCSFEENPNGFNILVKYLPDEERPWLMLWAAIAIRNLGKKALPLVPQIKKTLEGISGEVWGRYRDWLYTMFTGMALDQALINCGFEIEPYR